MKNHQVIRRHWSDAKLGEQCPVFVFGGVSGRQQRIAHENGIRAREEAERKCEESERKSEEAERSREEAERNLKEAEQKNKDALLSAARVMKNSGVSNEIIANAFPLLLDKIDAL